MYRAAIAPPGTCPRCVVELAPYPLGGAVAHVCSSCGGVHLDNALSARAVTKLDRAMMELSMKAALSARARPETHGELRCTECGITMIRTYVSSAACAVDACPEHGTWFDPGELGDVARAYARMRRSRIFVGAGARPRDIRERETAAPSALDEGDGDESSVSLIDFLRSLLS